MDFVLVALAVLPLGIAGMPAVAAACLDAAVIGGLTLARFT